MRTPLLVALALAASAAVVAKPLATLPGSNSTAPCSSPIQLVRCARSAGKSTSAIFPVNVALHPGACLAAVLHSGWGQHEVRIFEVKSGRHGLRRLRSMRRSTASRGRPTERNFFASGAGTE